MWSALENMALRESLPPPLESGGTVHDILVSGQLDQGRYNLHFLGQRRSQPYLLKQFYALDTNAFLRWQNEARFIAVPQTAGFNWPVEEWRGGTIAPYLSGMTLDNWLKRDERSLNARLCIAARLAERIRVLHEAGIAHRWLSPNTIRIADRDLIITSFGHARYAGWDDFWADTPGLSGDNACSSPELLSGRECGYAEDIHALGAMLHLLMVGKPAFGMVKQFLRTLLPNSVPPNSPVRSGDVPPPVNKMIMACLDGNPDNRPHIFETVNTLRQCCGNAPSGIEAIVMQHEKEHSERPDKVMVFVKDDHKAISLFDHVIQQAKTTPSLFLFVGITPSDLPSGHFERFKGSLFRKLSHGLVRCRAVELEWSLRVIDNVVPEAAARHLIQTYTPDRIMLGSTQSADSFLGSLRSFEHHLKDEGVPIESIS